jgi:hypothetical protein
MAPTCDALADSSEMAPQEGISPMTSAPRIRTCRRDAAMARLSDSSGLEPELILVDPNAGKSSVGGQSCGKSFPPLVAPHRRSVTSIITGLPFRPE